MITPGPNFFITVQTAIGGSRKSALFVVLGIGAGTVVWAVSGFLGIHFLFQTVPWVYLLLKLLGGSYLVYLGIKLIVSKTDNTTGDQTAHLKKSGNWHSFKLGLLTNLSNPKTAAFIASLFAATIPADVSWHVGMISIALVFLISICWYSMVAYVFSLHRFRLLFDKSKSFIERLAGVIFIGFGVKLAIGE